MNIAFVHFSDFHISSNSHFLDYKIKATIKAISTIKNIDEYVIIFSGDLVNSGNANEYKKARFLMNKLLFGIKELNGGKFTSLFYVPGNHDLALPQNARIAEDIIDEYNNKQIDNVLNREISYLDNYYDFVGNKNLYNRLLQTKKLNFNNYLVQLNLINTSPFSTLKPNDKELHYFPENEISNLRRGSDVNLCITVMHHSYEWFNWNSKNHLEKEIINTSEIIFTGHDHIAHNTSVSVDNSSDTCISAAGKIDYCSSDSVDSFNMMVVNSSDNTINGYIFNWNSQKNIFVAKNELKNKQLHIHASQIKPLPSYIKEIKYDSYNHNKNLFDYFVIPKISIETIDKYDKPGEINNKEQLIQYIINNKKIAITGSENSGKTTLLKYIFLSLSNNMVPLFLSIEPGFKFKIKNIVKRLFEEQYSDFYLDFEEYKQLNKSKKCIIIDGLDLLDEKTNKSSLIDLFESEFDIIVYTSNNNNFDLINCVFEQINEGSKYHRLNINPFYKNKREELVKKICKSHNKDYTDGEIENINNYINTIVKNNMDMFSLSPAFIIKYANFFIESSQIDYVRGEAIFSNMFEFDLKKALVNNKRNEDLDDLLLMLEEIAGNMYKMKKDIISLEETTNIINAYNETYDSEISPRTLIEIALNSKIFKQFDDYSICFYNKNHLAFFIAKYFIKNYNNPDERDEIQKSIQNICFGLNSEIILFITYILNDISMIKQIAKKAEVLTYGWEKLKLSSLNISILSRNSILISPPNKVDEEEYSKSKEKNEEIRYSNTTISAKGVFDYDETEIEQQHYVILRAIKYTEMLCRALPAFSRILKKDEKNKLASNIYSYSRKIAFAILSPLNENFDEICEEFYTIVSTDEFLEKHNKQISKKDIEEMFISYSQAVLLGLFDHFSELCTNSKTKKYLFNNEIEDYSEQIFRLMISKTIANSELVLSEAEKAIKTNDELTKMLSRMIVKRYLVINKNISNNKKQKIKDKIFTETLKNSNKKKRKYLTEKI